MRFPANLASLAVGLETLRANPMRTLLSMLGMVMGVGALVSVLSLGDGMERYARAQIEETTDLLSVSVTPSFFREVDGVRLPRTDVLRFTHDDVASLKSVVPAGTIVTLLQTGQALVTSRGDTTPTAAQITGTSAIGGDLPAPVAHGRFFSDDEVRRDAPVAVISAALADRVRGSRSQEQLVGDTLLFQRAPRVVIGVLAPAELVKGAMAFMPVNASGDAMAPALVGRPIVLMLKVEKVEDVAGVRARVEQWLGDRVGPSWKSQATISTNEMRVAQAQQGMLLFKLFMGALTGISLLVGGVGIMNVLLASVAERTREIGIRKATGARHGHILGQFLFESLAITSVGSLIGLVLGLAVAFGATAVLRSLTKAPMYAWVSPSTVLVAVVASAVIGVGFGLYPALRAARLSPIEAIRHE
jgi:putative ABC transport system permease protein